ncbi:SHOCT domain-containing protein [Euzebya sp.]|uniref:SHOCT domain-containing protein n=1 Tax=Euzebya sp. TaxID=1971409 RepID=UPI003513D329
MMWGWNGMTTGGWILMTAFWVGVIALIVWAVARQFPRDRTDENVRRETPEEILDRRFANGELDAEEYRDRRQEVRSRGVHNGEADHWRRPTVPVVKMWLSARVKDTGMDRRWTGLAVPQVGPS